MKLPAPRLAKFAPAALIAAAIALSACANTVRGVARDLNETGQAVDDAVN